MDHEDLKPDERRDTRRRATMLAASIHINGHVLPCQVRNLSAGGMMVRIDVPLAQGTPVHIDLSRYGRFPAVVAWVDGRDMGLVFPEGNAAALARLGDAAVRLGLRDEGVPRG